MNSDAISKISHLGKIFSWLTGPCRRFIHPKSTDEDRSRKELILNLILCFSIVGFLLINLIRFFDVISNPADRGLPFIITLAILFFFLFLAFMSRRGNIKTASWLLIAAYCAPMIYSFWSWGADLPAALLLGVLIITFCGLLFSAKTAFYGAALLNLFLLFLTRQQSAGIIQVKGYWRAENHEIGDAIVYAVLLLLMTALILIFDKEIRRALVRARSSEQALKQERDELEVKVAERTRLAREMEADKISQLYRLAEFGRISSGIFHDLINPLTAVSLNLEQVKVTDLMTAPEEIKLENAKNCLSQAIAASRKMEDLIACIKRSIKQENCQSVFSISEEITNTIRILTYKARLANVEVIVEGEKDVCCHGDPVKFGQVITNLICNGIEACEQRAGTINEKPYTGQVTLKVKRNNSNAIITVTDNGCGISSENMNRIFQPFFSTKENKGLGLGLSSTKSIIENNFGGTISLSGGPMRLTKFTINIPLVYAS